jgi:hypothetical protein
VYALYVYLTDFPGWITMTAIAFFVQSLVPRKAIGYVVVILVWVLNTVTTNLGYDYRLLQLGTAPAFRWSDLNGTGPYLAAFPAVQGFNLCLALLFLCLTYLVWQRSSPPSASGYGAGFPPALSGWPPAARRGWLPPVGCSTTTPAW